MSYTQSQSSFFQAIEPRKWSPNRLYRVYVLPAELLFIRAGSGEEYDGKLRHFTSGMTTTYKKFDQEFGRFEIRCRVPQGRGLWPAFWMLPEPLAWPPEIDIVETIGHDTRTIHFTHHWQDAQGHQQDTRAWKTDGVFGREFHVVAMQWSAADIRWEVDGIERFRSTRSIPKGKMFLLLNVAVGGDWPGPPSNKTPFPSAFEVDWVRCYARER